MAKVKRVFEIAKELGVDSKAIIAKCQAEDVPGVVTHMSPVKLGLEATIREWFSDSHNHVTAIETSTPVDLTKARKARRKRGGKEEGTAEHEVVVADEEQEQAGPQVAVEVAEPPIVAPVVESPPAAVAALPPIVAAPPAAAVTAPPESPAHLHAHRSTKPAPPPAAPEPATPATTVPPAAAGAAVLKHRVIKPLGKPNQPERPTVVAPAGPKLGKPQQAVLRGPNVVRIEQPDVIHAPRSRRPSGPQQGGGKDAEGGTLPGILRSRGPARGRGAGTAGPEEEGDKKPSNNKRRSLTTRRGRSASAALPTGPTKFSEQDLIELDARLNSATGYVKLRRREFKKREGVGPMAQSLAVTGGKVEVEEPITIKALSSATGIKATDIIKYLFKKGSMATINSAIGAEVAMEVALEYNIELVVKEQQTEEQRLIATFDDQAAIDVRRCPPVVTIMGHVDHGKTSLLDRIRQTDVAAHEAGGITQHIGAYRVTVKGGDGKDKTVVFLDTPGHEAFTSLRSRGASITDLVVLVVSAADGVMPQTIESINHAKAAEVPLIVALNKIDRPDATEANIRKIYGQLAEQGLNPTEWGGTTEVLKVSATTGQGVTELLEVLDYQAELLEVQADYGGPARGTVIEALMQPGRGPVGRVLVQQGTLKVGDFVVMGRAFGRVRDMTDDRGRNLVEAGPATPLEISGIDLLPDAGDKFYITDSLQKAEEIAGQVRERERLRQLASQTKVTLENFAEAMKTGVARELKIVLKADVQGSVDVLKKTLTDLSTSEVKVNILHAAVGGVTESDVLLAEASDAVVIGFNVVAPAMVRELAEQRHVEIRPYRIIYEITDDVRKGLEGLLEPEVREEIFGTAEVREVFKIGKLGIVAGCVVNEGSIQRAGKVRVTRQDVVVTDERGIESLRHFKEDAKEVRAGGECGIKLDGFDDLKNGDKIVCYQKVTIKRKLGSK